MKWNWDFGIKNAKIDKQRAEYRRLVFTKENAEMGIPIQIAELYHQLVEWQKAEQRQILVVQPYASGFKLGVKKRKTYRADTNIELGVFVTFAEEIN